MDHFAAGTHHVYEYAQNSSVPLDGAMSPPSSPPNIRRNVGSERQHSSSDADSLLYFASNASHSPCPPSYVDPASALPAEDLSSARTTKGASQAGSSKSGRIPRPRNAFMIFRAEFSTEKIKRAVEHDNRLISRIIGNCWNKLSEDEKLVWRRKAELEKLIHSKKHPNYRFTPTVRAKKPIKRQVNRNGRDEILRCQQVADLILSGKEGEELVEAVKKIAPLNESTHRGSEEMVELTSRPVPHHGVRGRPYPPPFRSPLLPPLELPAGRSSNQFLMHSGTTYRTNQYAPRQASVLPTPVTPPSSPVSPYFMESSRGQFEYYAIEENPYSFPPYANTARCPAYVQSSSYPYTRPGPEPTMRFVQDLPNSPMDTEQSYTFLSPSLPPSRLTVPDTILHDSK